MSDFTPLLDLLGRRDEHFYGATVGLVTNTRDPEGLGRVKVRFPLLSDHESSWARVVTPMAGRERGFFFLPEVDDEVLVLFEHGSLHAPYILGGLWNGADVPPETNQDGRNNIRLVKSRSGHTIRLDDTEGAEKITIADKSGKDSITFDAAQNTLTIAAEADITIESRSGAIKLSAQSVEISGKGGVTLASDAGMDVKAAAQLKIKGATVDIN